MAEKCIYVKCIYVGKEEIRSIIANYYGVDLTDVKFGVGMGANVFNLPEDQKEDTNGTERN